MSRRSVVRPIAAVEWSPSGIRLSDGRLVPPGANGIPSPSVVALSRRSIFVRSARVPNIPEEAVRQALVFQVGQMFPVDSTQAAWDFVLGSNVDAEGRIASVFGCQNSTLQELAEDLQRRNLKATAVVPIALGSMLIAKSLGLSTCAVIERLPDGFGIDIIHDGALRASRTVGLSVSLETEAALAMASASVPTGPVVGCGGLEGPGIEMTSDATPLEMLIGSEALQLDVHLEHPERAAERARRRSQTRLRQGFLLAGAAVLFWVLIFMDRSDAAEEKRAAEARWNARLTKLRKERSTVESDLVAARKKEAVIDRAFSPAQPISDVLTVFGRAVPSSAWLTGLNLERGKNANLRGSAMTSEAVGSLVQSMSGEPRFRDVRLLFANKTEIDKTPVVQFAVGLHVVGNLPLAAPDKGRKVTRN